MKAGALANPDPPPAETDLRGITRMSKLVLTSVVLHWDWDKRVPWLKFGQAQLVRDSDRNNGKWRLEARMTEGVTDAEHDSAYALRLPLIGVHLEGVQYHQTSIIAYVSSDLGPFSEFHVPRPGYNPVKHKDAFTCKHCEEHHRIVPGGFYVPPFDPVLYRMVSGKRIDISIGPVFPEEKP